jgi:glycosyltransferase involved in cell wall biosynthesis
MRRVPTVISLDATPRNFDSLGAGYGHNQANRMVEGIKWRLTARVLHAAQALVAFSDWVRRSLIDDYGVPAERIHVIPPGVDLARWSVPAGRSASNGHEDAPFRLLFVGGEFERKGGPLLLDVFRQSLRDCCELHIVTKANVEEEPGVHVYRDFGPNEQSLRHLYEHCDVLVLPSRADTFSHASLEAMACGLPVVSCPVGGIPEIVRQGETGFLIPPDDGRALLTAIQGLLHDRGQAEALGEAGRKAVEARFDAARNAQRIRDLMTGLVRK